jgi:transcriptional regulator with XRE-family HTH domain
LEKLIVISFGEVLRRLRRERGLTQEDLGLRANVQRKHISYLELGEKEVSITTLYKLAYALRLSPGRLVTLTDAELKARQVPPDVNS